MKKTSLLLSLAALFATLSLPAHADVTGTINAGDLKANAAGTTPLGNGDLILLIAAGTDGIFDNSLTAGQYAGGDDVILGDFASNSNLGSTGEFSGSFDFTATSGQALELRWFPSITDAQYESNPSLFAPTAGQAYGYFAGATTGSPNGGNAWVVPTNGTSLYNLNFVTNSMNTSNSYGFGDAVANSNGFASSTIAAVPEPATVWSLVSGLVIGAVFLRRRRAVA